MTNTTRFAFASMLIALAVGAVAGCGQAASPPPGRRTGPPRRKSTKAKKPHARGSRRADEACGDAMHASRS